MIRLQYDPYSQTAVIQNQGREDGSVSDFDHLSKELRDALKMLKTDIILQNQIENLVTVLQQIVGSKKVDIRFIGTQKDHKDLCDGLKLLAPECTAEKFELQYYHDADYIREQLSQVRDNVSRCVDELNRKYPEYSDKLRFDFKGLNAALNDRTPLVFVGSGSAGKSSVINALIGAEVLETGNGTTTEAVYEIIPDAKNFEVTYKLDNDIVRFDFNKSKEDAKKQVEAAFHTEISFDTNNRYDWVYRTVEMINRQSGVSELHIHVPFKNLTSISNQIVLYDTPGPDSKTRTNHKSVLNEALRGFKKGVVIFVTRPNEIEKTNLRSFMKEFAENAEQLSSILNVNAGIVVFNGADESNLSSINSAKSSRRKNLTGIDDETDRQEFLFEQDRMIYFSSPYALGINKAPGDAWMDPLLEEKASNPTKVDDPDYKFYLPLATAAELPRLRKDAIVEAYKIAEQRYRENKNEENKRELIAHNSGLRALEFELGFVVNELSVCNLCAQAQKRLKFVLRFVERRIEEISRGIAENEGKYQEKFNEKYTVIVASLFGGSPTSALNKAVYQVKQKFNQSIGRDDENCKKAVTDVLKNIDNQWAKEKKDVKTLITNSILNDATIKMIQSTRNVQAKASIQYCFDEFRKECQKIVDNAKTLSTDEQKAFQECMKNWNAVKYDGDKINLKKHDVMSQFLFIKYPDKRKSKEAAEKGTDQLLRDHITRVRNAVIESFRESCDEARNSFYTEERLKAMNPELNELSLQIDRLKQQYREYQEFQDKIAVYMERTNTLTEMQEKRGSE